MIYTTEINGSKHNFLAARWPGDMKCIDEGCTWEITVSRNSILSLPIEDLQRAIDDYNRELGFVDRDR